MTGILDEKIVKSGRPHDRDAGTNVVAQREKIDHLRKRDQYGLDLENGRRRRGRLCTPARRSPPKTIPIASPAMSPEVYLGWHQ